MADGKCNNFLSARLDYTCGRSDMKTFYFVSRAGTDDVEWCFSQVKGTVEEEVTEGRREEFF